jgi:hypothetical protein
VLLFPPLFNVSMSVILFAVWRRARSAT